MKKIPQYALYRRDGDEVELRLMHIETLEAGNRDFDWDIAAHRHSDLYQIIWVGRGSGTVELDERSMDLGSPVIIYVPPPIVHGFRWVRGSDGFVLTMSRAPMMQLLRSSGVAEKPDAWSDLVVASGDDFEEGRALYIKRVLCSLYEEYAARHSYRHIAMASGILAMLTEVARFKNLGLDKVRQKNCLTKDRSLLLYRKFIDLVETQYSRHDPVSEYARLLAVSTRYLSRLCLDFSGTTPGQIIQKRISLEAKRSLLYTDKTVSEIAFDLGFSEPSYFTKFFARNEDGATPVEFRRANRTAVVGDE